MAWAVSLRRSRADFEQRLAPRPRLARAGKPLLHLAQGLLAALQLGLGEGKIVGGLAPLALRRGDGVEQAAAPLLDLGREIGKRGKVGAGLGLARAQGLDLLARLGDAVLPKLLLGGDRLDPLLPEAHLALEALQRGLGAGMGRAAFGGVAMRALKRRLEHVERGKLKRADGIRAKARAPHRARPGSGSWLRQARRAACSGRGSHARRRRWRRGCGQARRGPGAPSGGAPWSPRWRHERCRRRCQPRPRRLQSRLGAFASAFRASSLLRSTRRAPAAEAVPAATV